MDIDKQDVVITGGGSGLGAATAKLFADCGATVHIIDIDHDAGQELAKKVGGYAYHVDVAKDQEVAAAMAKIGEHTGSLGVLVNAAGCAAPLARVVGRRGAYSIDEFRRVVEVNLIGGFNCARLAASQMVSNKPGPRGERGLIIQVSSITAFDCPSGTSAYTAAKAGINALTLTMARDLASSGIRVCTIAPGSFDTPLLNHGLPEMLDDVLAEVPFPRDALGDPEDFAALALHICKNTMLNGEIIRLDGAARLHRN